MRHYVPLDVIFVLVLATVGEHLDDTRSCSDAMILSSIKCQLGLMEKTDVPRCSSKLEISKVAFLARLENNIPSLSEGATVIFQTVITNEGSGYNPTTGVFTAPWDGPYFFTWSTLTRIGESFATEIVLNGKWAGVRNHGHANRNSNHNHPSSQSAVLAMKKDDMVWIRTYGSAGYCIADAWTTFMGFAI